MLRRASLAVSLLFVAWVSPAVSRGQTPLAPPAGARPPPDGTEPAAPVAPETPPPPTAPTEPAAPAPEESPGPAPSEPPPTETAPAPAEPAPPPEPTEPPPPVGWAPREPAPTPGAGESAYHAGIVEPPAPPPPASPDEVDSISMFAVYYNVAIPFGDTRDFAADFSWWGFSFDFRQRLVPKVALGVSFEWQGFSEKTRETVTLGAVSVTGTQVREETSFPLLATGHYYLRDAADSVLPFVGAGVGGYRVNRTLDVGPTVRFTDAEWLFGFAPEIGVSFPSSTGALIVRSRFHIALQHDAIPQQMYWTFALGGAL